MEIGNNPNRPVQQPAQERSARPELSSEAGRAAAAAVQPNQTGARPEPVNANPPASAQVALSNSAVQLLNGGDEQDSFDTVKVERISREIEEGSYEVDAEAVADRLIANTRELLNRKPSET